MSEEDREFKELLTHWLKYYREIRSKKLKPLDAFDIYVKNFGLNYRGLSKKKHDAAKAYALKILDGDKDQE